MEIAEMVSRLIAGKHRIYLEVGRFGRKDRFVLVLEETVNSRRAIQDLQTEPGAETFRTIEALDKLVETNQNIGVLYSNCRKRGYCLWVQMTNRNDWAVEKIAPVYQRRIAEQERICASKLKRGHTAFGFLSMEGHS
jgi:hypothetical protein